MIEYRRHKEYGRYFISSKGEVFSARKNWAKLPSTKNNKGYNYVTIFHEGKSMRKSIHSLVAGTYLDYSGDQVNHKDLNKDNNSVENLEYCSMSYNLRHRNFGKKRFVNKQTTTGKYQIRIRENNKYLFTPGQFEKIDEAYTAAREYYTNHFGFEPWSK